MNLIFFAALLLPAAPLTSQRLRLEPGDYRYMPLPVRATPAEIDAQFHVVSGAPTVHVELLLREDLRLFLRGKDHQRIASTPDAASGEFQHFIEDPGDYEILIANAKDAPPATVTLDVGIDRNPPAAVYTRELPPQRRLAAILISFGIFFTIVTYSGLRLTRAIKRTR